MEIVVNQLFTISQEVLDKINSLLPVLSDNLTLLTFEKMTEIINSDNTTVFIAEEDGEIVGMLTLATYVTPSGPKAWIEDVVVDKTRQGKGIGKVLVEKAIEHANQLNMNRIDLTTNPARVAANVLYQKIGFKKRETNVYRFLLTK